MRIDSNLNLFHQVAFDINEELSNHHVPLLLSPFGYVTYRGSHAKTPSSSDTIINIMDSTYFIGPGREAGAKSEILTISTQSTKSCLSSYKEITSTENCGNVSVPDYPLGERSGYSMEVISFIFIVFPLQSPCMIFYNEKTIATSGNRRANYYLWRDRTWL